MKIPVPAIRNKRTLKKQQKLIEFLKNSTNYLSLIIFQTKIDRFKLGNNSGLRSEIKAILEQILDDHANLKVNQIKLIYHALKDGRLFLGEQTRILKLFAKISMQELEEVPPENEEESAEVCQELMAANKDLIELFDLITEVLAF